MWQCRCESGSRLPGQKGLEFLSLPFQMVKNYLIHLFIYSFAKSVQLLAKKSCWYWWQLWFRLDVTSCWQEADRGNTSSLRSIALFAQARAAGRWAVGWQVWRSMFQMQVQENRVARLISLTQHTAAVSWAVSAYHRCGHSFIWCFLVCFFLLSQFISFCIYF